MTSSAQDPVLRFANAIRPPDTTSLMQLGFVVQDRQQAIHNYAAMLGAGPWFLSPEPYPEPPFTEYRGARVSLGARFAMAYVGDIMIELIEPLPGSETVFSDALATNGPGLHHFAFGARDFDAAITTLIRENRAPIFRSTTPRGARIAMSEPAAWSGALEEYIELTPESETFYARMRSAASNWNGRDLIADQY